MHVLAELQVESAERLVEKQKFRLVYDRASDGNPLLLASQTLYPQLKKMIPQPLH